MYHLRNLRWRDNIRFDAMLLQVWPSSLHLYLKWRLIIASWVLYLFVKLLGPLNLIFQNFLRSITIQIWILGHITNLILLRLDSINLIIPRYLAISISIFVFAFRLNLVLVSFRLLLLQVDLFFQKSCYLWIFHQFFELFNWHLTIGGQEIVILLFLLFIHIDFSR